MSREITSVKFPSFANYTDEMYKGNKPSRESKYFKNAVDYVFEYGEASFCDQMLLACNVTIDNNIVVTYWGGNLKITQFGNRGIKDMKYFCFDYYHNDVMVSTEKFFTSVELNKITTLENNDCFVVKEIKTLIKNYFLAVPRKDRLTLPKTLQNWYITNI